MFTSHGFLGVAPFYLFMELLERILLFFGSGMLDTPYVSSRVGLRY